MLRWAIQTNLGKASDIQSLVKSCRELHLPYVELEHIPFSQVLPDLEWESPIVFYGATDFVTAIATDGRWSPGVYFDEVKFEFSTCLSRLGSRLLNSQAQVTTLRALQSDVRSDETEVFLRPTGDTKEFAGNVFTFREIKDWLRNIRGEDMTLSLDCPVLVSEPFGLAFEWRVFIVNGVAVTGSQYRRYHRLDIESGLPPGVVAFAEECAELYSPAEVFVMDVARSGESLYIVEYNCFNSSGFYASDVSQIVSAIETLSR